MFTYFLLASICAFQHVTARYEMIDVGQAYCDQTITVSSPSEVFVKFNRTDSCKDKSQTYMRYHCYMTFAWRDWSFYHGYVFCGCVETYDNHPWGSGVKFGQTNAFDDIHFDSKKAYYSCSSRKLYCAPIFKYLVVKVQNPCLADTSDYIKMETHFAFPNTTLIDPSSDCSKQTRAFKSIKVVKDMGTVMFQYQRFEYLSCGLSVWPMTSSRSKEFCFEFSHVVEPWGGQLIVQGLGSKFELRYEKGKTGGQRCVKFDQNVQVYMTFPHTFGSIWYQPHHLVVLHYRFLDIKEPPKIDDDGDEGLSTTQSSLIAFGCLVILFGIVFGWKTLKTRIIERTSDSLPGSRRESDLFPADHPIDGTGSWEDVVGRDLDVTQLRQTETGLGQHPTSNRVSASAPPPLLGNYGDTGDSAFSSPPSYGNHDISDDTALASPPSYDALFPDRK